jgi:1,4-dihydroxy-2-naphthoate octaprenyltransferase
LPYQYKPSILNAAIHKITPGNLFDRDTILHLRIPFSFYLLPVFLFGLSQAHSFHLANTLIVFIALHLFIYPGSNSYNSYMDNDTGSIGGLEKPPPVTKKLYYASIIIDIAGLLLCALSGWQNAMVMAGYVGFSKAYSWHGIRLKKYPYLSWASVMFFQGGYTYMLANMAAENQVALSWFTSKNLECMLFASLIIGGSYPLTQIYQHEEDGLRGDYTISYRLGVVGTFVFTTILFVSGAIVALHYFTAYYSISQFIVFICCIVPVIIYFLSWFRQAALNNALADYTHAMLMNKVSSFCMVICFLIILWLNVARPL